MSRGINLYLIRSLSYAPAFAICCIGRRVTVLLGSSVPAALGLGSRINYNPLFRIEINDIGFVFYGDRFIGNARLPVRQARKCGRC